MTCYDSSLSDQDDPRSSEFFCLISATSIVTEEFFRQKSNIYSLKLPTSAPHCEMEKFLGFRIFPEQTRDCTTQQEATRADNFIYFFIR